MFKFDFFLFILKICKIVFFRLLKKNYWLTSLSFVIYMEMFPIFYLYYVFLSFWTYKLRYVLLMYSCSVCLLPPKYWNVYKHNDIECKTNQEWHFNRLVFSTLVKGRKIVQNSIGTVRFLCEKIFQRTFYRGKSNERRQDVSCATFAVVEFTSDITGGERQYNVHRNDFSYIFENDLTMKSVKEKGVTDSCRTDGTNRWVRKS